MTILLVEDEAEIRAIQGDYLRKAGYQIVEAPDGHQALDIFAAQKIDLVVLDLNLPGLDGIEICRALRQTSDVPIIMVTARTQEADELLGLDLGADDYIKKPFSPRILVARVQALLKRPLIVSNEPIIKHGDLTINIPAMTVSIKDQMIDFTVIQFNLLLTLAQNPGRIFTRNDLLDHAYDSSIAPDIFDRTIDAHIKNIRKKIEPNSSHPSYLLTVRGRGYKFNENLV
ncbi:MAG TPA: response regulator transcription factor [Candidatus Wirthbacteria bacterium]|nr:response regulator transcription factor [Candidatus Wirthbacteria bacterium]